MENPPSLVQLYQDLSSRNADVRAESMRRARALPPADLLAVCELNVKQYRKRFRRERVAIFSTLGAAFTAAAALAYFVLRGDLYSDYIMPGSSAAMFWVPIAVSLLSERLARDRSPRRLLLQILGETNDTSYIAPALLMLSINFHSRPSKLRQDLRVMVLRLLPQLRFEQAQSWTNAQRSVLLSPVMTMRSVQNRHDHNYAYAYEMAIVVLRALEQIGDERELKIVQQLANLTPRINRDRQLKQAALDCLPYLEIRAGERKQSQTLLRPSASSATPAANVLLRPTAAAPSATPPEQLLRPNNPTM